MESLWAQGAIMFNKKQQDYTLTLDTKTFQGQSSRNSLVNICSSHKSVRIQDQGNTMVIFQNSVIVCFEYFKVSYYDQMS